MRDRLRLLTSALLIAVIQGCGTQPPTTEPAPGDDRVTTAPDGRELTEIEQLLLQAESGTPLEKTEYTLQAAERLFAENTLDQADQLLQTLNPLMLTADREQQYWLLRARIASTRLQPQLSLDWIARITQPDLLSIEEQIRLSQLEAENYRQLGDSSIGLNTLIERSAMADDTQRPLITTAGGEKPYAPRPRRVGGHRGWPDGRLRTVHRHHHPVIPILVETRRSR